MKKLFYILLLSLSFHLAAEEKTVFIQSEVYQLNDAISVEEPMDKLLSHSTLISSPKLMVYAGKTASVEVGNNESHIIRLEIQSDEAASYFVVNFSAKEKEGEGWRIISFETPKIAMGETTYAKSSLSDKQLLVKVTGKLL